MHLHGKIKKLKKKIEGKYMKNSIIRVIKETMKDPVKREKVMNAIKPYISKYTNKKK